MLLFHFMKNNNYLRNSVLALLFLTPFVGFVLTTGLFFPYITGKTLVFRGLIEIAFALYLILALRVPEYRPKINTILLAFSTFIGIIFIADIFGEFPFKSFWSNYERMEGFLTLFHLFVYYVMMSAMFTGEKLWTRFFQVSLAASVIMGLISFDPVKEQAGRVFANLGNSTYLGIYMLFHMFIAGFLLVRVIERKGTLETKWMKGLLYGAIILFNFYIFYRTGTRGALLGLLAGAFFTSVAFAFWEKNKGLKILGISVLTAIILIVGSLALFKESQFITERPLLTRFASLATFDKAEFEKFTTTQGKSRFGIWGIAYEGFKERPVLGWGQDNFNYVFNKYYDPKIYDQEQWFDRAHNVFFDWLIAGGILGLLSYLALFVTAFIVIWRSRTHEKDLYFLFSDKVLLSALLIAYFIHNLFVFDSLTSYLLFFAILAFISIHDRKLFAAPALAKPIKNPTYLMAGSVIAVVIGVTTLYYFTIAPYRASATLLEALSYQNQALSKDNVALFPVVLDKYNNALAYDSTVGILEAREQLLQGASNVLFYSSATNEIKSRYLQRTQEEMEKMFNTVPGDTRYHLFYGAFLARLGGAASSTELVNEGLNHLRKASELSPRKQTIAFEVGAAYINNNQYKEALPFFKKAYESEPTYTDARFLYALALIYAGDVTGGEELLKPLTGTRYMADDRLVRAYFKAGQTAKLGDIMQFKLTYAKQLLVEGKKAEAVDHLNDVISLSPRYKAEAEKILKSI
jgi:O-antigen ligase